MAEKIPTDSTTPISAQAIPPLTIERRPIGSLRPYHRNARQHPAEQIEQIRQSLREYGFTVPILIREDGTVIAGHGRLEAARKEAFSDVPVVVAKGWTEEQCRAYALIDNRLSEQSVWDANRLAEELQALQAQGIDLGFYGLDQDDLDDDEKIEVREVETSPVEDMFWISVRGPLADQAKALQRLQDVMAEMPAVDVEIGTIAYD